MKKWLDKYNDVPKAENGIEGTMGGLTDVGFNYNGAWGGTMQDGGNITMFSPEFYDKLKKEYNEFYSVKSPYRPHSDDFYDDFFRYKTAKLPKVQTSRGSGWFIKDGDYEQFVEAEKDSPMPKRVEKKKGTKTFIEDYKVMSDNPMKQQYADAIRNLVIDKFRPKSPIEQALKLQTGGSIPGAVGFTYARTGSIPSNGPYAKKTKASAQNGKSVKYKTQDKAKLIEDKITDIENDLQEKYIEPEVAKAFKQAKLKGVGYGAHNGPLDAIRHATAASKVASSIPIFGLPIANVLGAAHEISGEYANEKELFSDLYNNFIGSVVGSVPFVSDDTKRNWIIEAQKKGILSTISNDKPKTNNNSKVDPRSVREKLKRSGQLEKLEKLEEVNQKSTGKKIIFEDGGSMKYYQEGLDFKPKNISQDGKLLPKWQQKLNQETAKLDDPFSVFSLMKKGYSKSTATQMNEAAAKATTNQPQVAPSYEPINAIERQNRKEQVKAKNKAYAQQTGKRYNERTGAVEPLVSPKTEKALNTVMTNFVEPAIMISPIGELGMAADAFRLAKAATPIVKSAVKDVSENMVGDVVSGLYKLSQQLPAGAAREHLAGISHGIADISRGRPFFETFPITRSQKLKVEAAQDKAFNEGISFVEDWFYPGDVWGISPQVEKRIENIFPDLYSQPTNLNSFKGNPFNTTKNLLVSTRSSDLLKNRNLSNNAKDYIREKRGMIGGVNLSGSNESITFRNNGFYYKRPSSIKETAAHEAGHTSQLLGHQHENSLGEFINYRGWGDEIATTNPAYKYHIPNTQTPFGQKMADAMVPPVVDKRVWEASPLEPHSELMVARMKAYDGYIKRGLDPKEAMDLLQNPSDELLDWIIKNQNLNRFFKKTTSEETKRDILKNLPAAIPAVGVGIGAAALQNQQPSKQKNGGWLSKYEEGGVIKDDMGQWAHPGEITEIGSNQITMEGVPYPVLGISDTGDVQMMYPEEEYEFDGESVTEYPVMQKGGRVPIYTENPRDPRLRAYQDSLSLYRQSLKNMATEGTSPDYKKLGFVSFNDAPIMLSEPNAYEKNDQSYPFYGSSRPSNKNEVFNERIKPVGFDVTYLPRINSKQYSSIYKKPVQPIEYRKTEPPTLYVDNLNDPRLRAYQDSLALYNKWNSKGWREHLGLGKGVEISDIYRVPYNPKGETKNANKKSIPIGSENMLGTNWREVVKESTKNKIKPLGYLYEDLAVPAYKKPVQPVKYRKPESKKEQPVKKQEQSKPVERKQNVYEGFPVYSPGTGSGLPSALIGFANQQGDTTYIKPEDYERFAVPKYGKEFIESKKKQRNGGVNSADAQPIKKLDQLLNFTNYNKPTKGGWLNKYQ